MSKDERVAIVGKLLLLLDPAPTTPNSHSDSDTLEVEAHQTNLRRVHDPRPARHAGDRYIASTTTVPAYRQQSALRRSPRCTEKVRTGSLMVLFSVHDITCQRGADKRMPYLNFALLVRLVSVDKELVRCCFVPTWVFSVTISSTTLALSSQPPIANPVPPNSISTYGSPFLVSQASHEWKNLRIMVLYDGVKSFSSSVT
jgi:hypothetical protein